MSRTTRSFTPLENKTITWAATANSQFVQFTTQISLGSTFLQGSSNVFPNCLKIDNQTGVSVFLKAQQGSGPTAAITDFEINADSPPLTIDIGQADFVAVIPASSASGSVYLSRGTGGL